MLKCCRWHFDIRRDHLWQIHLEGAAYEQQKMSFTEEMSFSDLIFPLYFVVKGISLCWADAWVLRMKCQPVSRNSHELVNLSSWVTSQMSRDLYICSQKHLLS